MSKTTLIPRATPHNGSEPPYTIPRGAGRSMRCACLQEFPA
jgi:hypothetical protein